VADNNGNAVWSWEGEPFGSMPPNTNPSGLGNFTLNLRFPGQYFDQETGLHYNYYRDYDPNTGRYIESDPVGLWGGSSAPTTSLSSQPALHVVTPVGSTSLAGLITFASSTNWSGSRQTRTLGALIQNSQSWYPLRWRTLAGPGPSVGRDTVPRRPTRRLGVPEADSSLARRLALPRERGRDQAQEVCQRMPLSISGTNPPIVLGVTTPAPVLVLRPAKPYFFDSTHCVTGRKP